MSMEFNIKSKLEVFADTSQAEQQINQLKGSVNNNSENGDNSTSVLDESFNALGYEVKNVLTSFKSLCDVLDDTQKKLYNQSTQNNYEKKRKDELVPSNNIQSKKENDNVSKPIGTVESTALSVINGNLSGAFTQAVKNAGVSMYGIGRNAQDGSMLEALKYLGPAVMVAGTGLAIGNALSKKYEEKLPDIDDLLTVFGGNTADRTASQNASLGQYLFDMSASYNQDTGLSNTEFMKLISSTGKWGITNFDTAANIAKQGQMWSRFTGVDNSQAIDFMGMIERYGGNGTETIKQAYGAAMASGLEKNQFGEFLDGIERVMERGISNGFIKSADEVSESLTMLARLSGNDPLWQGKNGARQYEKIVGGMESATSLSNTSQMMLYQAANMAINKEGAEKLLTSGGKFRGVEGDSWLNSMALLESGNFSAVMPNVKNIVNNAYGEDQASRVKTYMDMFGLNYLGGIALDKMDFSKMSDSEINKEIANLKRDPKMLSDQTKLQNVLSNLDKTLTDLGKGAFDIKLGGLEVIEKTTTAMLGIMSKENRLPFEEQLFDMQDNRERGVAATLKKNSLYKGNLLNFAVTATPEELSYANANNLTEQIAKGVMTPQQLRLDMAKHKSGYYYNNARDANFTINGALLKDRPFNEIAGNKELQRFIDLKYLYSTINPESDRNIDSSSNLGKLNIEYQQLLLKDIDKLVEVFGNGVIRLVSE